MVHFVHKTIFIKSLRLHHLLSLAISLGFCSALLLLSVVTASTPILLCNCLTLGKSQTEIVQCSKKEEVSTRMEDWEKAEKHFTESPCQWGLETRRHHSDS